MNRKGDQVQLKKPYKSLPIMDLYELSPHLNQAIYSSELRPTNSSVLSPNKKN